MNGVPYAAALQNGGDGLVLPADVRRPYQNQLVAGENEVKSAYFIVVMINNPALKETLLTLTTELGREVAETAIKSIIKFW